MSLHIYLKLIVKKKKGAAVPADFPLAVTYCVAIPDAVMLVIEQYLLSDLHYKHMQALHLSEQTNTKF